MICYLCGLKSKYLKSGVIQGKFGEYCTHCINGAKRMESTGFAQYTRDRDREEHIADMIQPWDRNGKPNREFINKYPEQSKEMFSEKELHDNG